MKINLTKKDIEVCLCASQYFFEAPHEQSLPDYEKEYEQWQKTKDKLLDALDEMEKS
tara:strand:+ start:363 stop:533 length:171 start_codon:yes stop_codon:yes gene_type:complete